MNRCGCMVSAAALALVAGVGSRGSQAQARASWQIGVGPAVAATRPRLPFDPSGGGMLRATYFHNWRRDGFSWGFDTRAAFLPLRLGGARVCTRTCSDAFHPRVLAMAAAGVAGQFSRSVGSATSAHVRGFAAPALSVAAVDDDTEAEAAVSPSAGLALGLTRGRLRLDFETQVLPNTAGKAPLIWSLQIVFSR